MFLRFLVVLVFLFCFACNNTNSTNTETEEFTRFNESKWKAKKGMDFPYRDQMLDDLMSDNKIRQLNKDELVGLLGEPSRMDSNYLFYQINQKRLALWPLHTKTLVIKLYPDSTAEWMKIHE